MILYLDNMLLIKYANILDKNGNILSYSYTPLFKIQSETDLIVAEGKQIKVRPIILESTYKFTYYLDNGFYFSTFNDRIYKKGDHIKTVVKIISDTQKQQHYENYIDLQIKIIEFINKGLSFKINKNIIKNNSSSDFIVENIVEEKVDNAIIRQIDKDSDIIIAGFIRI